MSIQPGTGYNFSNVGGATSLTIEPTWQYWTPPHPFTVQTYKSGTDYMVRVIPGTINNVEPEMSGTPLSDSPAPSMNIGYSASPATEYIYLTMPVGGSGTPPPFPDGPTITHDSTPQTSDNTTAYLLLASVDKSTGRVSQYVGGSQWGERWKCGSEDAVYYFGQV